MAEMPFQSAAIPGGTIETQQIGGIHLRQLVDRIHLGMDRFAKLTLTPMTDSHGNFGIFTLFTYVWFHFYCKLVDKYTIHGSYGL